eukprot:CAMPEP_0180519874 /NCGR_PEP_ID=MMETSP1036_2-20121128/55939_1 /TAXON_ID=632150 /ORGANISM="Azadinium spinosum, Strain 3D9" /LENGTH=79 /DNA_ID=CAMNT_0022532279 /DNA_START=40 /DNA_END=276 /DNA_ORIENTATION=-
MQIARSHCTQTNCAAWPQATPLPPKAAQGTWPLEAMARPTPAGGGACCPAGTPTATACTVCARPEAKPPTTCPCCTGPP